VTDADRNCSMISDYKPS